jgi:hypothetical protein
VTSSTLITNNTSPNNSISYGRRRSVRYSQLQTTIGATRKFKTRGELDQARQEHSKYVENVSEVIEYFDPTEEYIETPYFSAMKDLPCMSQLHSHRFDCCRFGFDYQKPTRVWTNRTNLEDITCSCAYRIHKHIGLESQTPTRFTLVERLT